MSSNVFSIRSRIFMVAVVLLLCLSAALAVFLHDYAQRAADRAFDRLLAASALSIAGAVQIEDNQVAMELPFAALAMLSGNERVFYTVRNAQGKLITGYDDLDRDLPLATSADAMFYDAHYRNDDVRISTVGRLASFNQQAAWVTVRVAETRGARQALAEEILNRSVLPLLIMVAVALGLLWFGVTHALAPLKLIENELRYRKPDDLHALASPVPREVRRLVDALNGFMLRLQGMLNSLNNLVADTAHQVRTPLASLRAQSEVALEETNPEKMRERLTRIHLNACRASQLVNQLLMDATITHRMESRRNDMVGIAEIINETRQRIGPLDLQRLRIAIAPEVRRARVWGDRVALREMLRNLVDNALRYAPAGVVEIQVDKLPGNRLGLTVADRGPGIASEESERVLERFGRGSAAEAMPGSGLGLSIVKSVVEAHTGTLTLRNRGGGGLLVCVTLPISMPANLERAGASVSLICAVVLMALASLVLPGRADAQGTGAPSDTITRYPAAHAGTTLTIAGSTDTVLFAPLALAFQKSQPDVELVYHELGTRQLYEQTVANALPQADVLISSAVDLQIKLANDGYALRHVSEYVHRLPSWAVWRSEVFGFTFEPIVLVYNLSRFSEETVPRSRQALLSLLEQDPVDMRGRIGTYDIAVSSVGHLLAVQDATLSSNFWGLANAFGQVEIQLEANTIDILDKIESGQLYLGYNVLGSYAMARKAAGHALGIVVPQDYVLVLSRAALIARSTAHPQLAATFLDWLLSPEGQKVAANQAGLGAITATNTEKGYPGDPFMLSQSIVQPIALTPALLVGLDQQRHSRFLKNWKRLVTDTPDRSLMTGH
ncbi:extracellular solute-binding protein [Alcaligenaceae bacterium]|nr:extracellular solute-binding protein [Alcaligenaceae bacterium]